MITLNNMFLWRNMGDLFFHHKQISSTHKICSFANVCIIFCRRMEVMDSIMKLLSLDLQ